MSSGAPNPFPTPRRIVTGHNEQGVAIVKSDGPLIAKEAAFEGRSHVAWSTGKTPADDNNTDFDGAERKIPGFGLVPRGGTNCRWTDLGPGVDVAMHRTASVDYNIVFSGELILVLEDGDERTVGPGDIVLQRGTLHGWRNPSSTQWVRMLSVLVDAEAAVLGGTALPDEWRGETAMGEP
ncbi:hypothetical protein BKA62DRAFT_470250 [Auriculariales sp. MPI-PUGE-AT-0066]|nr:hypothetical protein BKA62DRAFT_470250 [Auriculariales sp. MPI-PUGE-AT-0066]